MEAAALFSLSDANDELVVLRMPRTDARLPTHLSAGELAVVELVCAGLSNAEIAARRGTRPRTVANQIASIFTKLSVGSRHKLVAFLAGDERVAEKAVERIQTTRARSRSRG